MVTSNKLERALKFLRNYQHHVGLLRQDYRDRSSGGTLLYDQPHLLKVPPEVIEDNVQYLHSIGIGYPYHHGVLLETPSNDKRKKIAYLLRRLFDFRNLTPEQKKQAVSTAYAIVRDNPWILFSSTHTIERKLSELRSWLYQEKIEEPKPTVTTVKEPDIETFSEEDLKQVEGIK